MKEVLVNDQLILSYPDGFHIMTESERSKLNLLEDGQWIGLSDPDRHMIVTVGWKHAGFLTANFSTSNDLAKGMEKKIRKPMEPFGYRNEGFTDRVVAGEKACGFRYGYKAQSVDMVAESLVLKCDGTVVYFHSYMREALKEASMVVWNELLELVRKK